MHRADSHLFLHANDRRFVRLLGLKVFVLHKQIQNFFRNVIIPQNFL
ncbi:hypothetical protein TPHV1_160033 [Treponema phagedenis]|uniref:Uncharacterized protein n=1 Tax=Treponema phagedenis TaxID=162 RepID=A0A0B7GUL6_TREPH|nr:hypothetical protein TPHV1_160033 [Treponema phagedenis]